MYTYTIFHEGKEICKLENQQNDINLLGKMQKLQSNSMDWAIRHEGWQIELIDQKTGIKSKMKSYVNYCDFETITNG